MTDFLRSRAFLATLVGLSVIRLISIIVGSYQWRNDFLLAFLAFVMQTLILFWLLVRPANSKFYSLGIRWAFLLGVLGCFNIAVNDFLIRREIGISLNPLEIVFPIISTAFPILHFNNIRLIDTMLLFYWIPTLIIFYGLFIAALLITLRKNNDNLIPITQKDEDSNLNERSVNKDMNATPTWTVRIPGQPENPVDTATLQNWAKSSFIKADTMVTEVSTGYAYQAKQIPGVFSSKSYVTALLLSFFFGVFGVDRFYLGHVGVGLGKLFTFGGLGIWALIDFILIATKNIKDGQGIPLP